ncbi:YopX family protein [Helcococcus kunzii]|uniref:YopX family protein n=1 Tax=Helcococcus kunzii TaxID=40091 RepID=UPI0038B1E76A
MIPKFRAWHEQGFMLREENIVKLNLEEEKLEYCVLNEDGVRSDRECSFYEVKLMQSTGLFDKNDKEIFEGDIIYIFQKGVISRNLEAHDENRKVVFFEGSWCVENYADTGENFGNFIIENHYPIGLYHTKDELEVIGNIYENPELLEVENEY